MRIALDCVFYLLCTMNGCFSTPACDYSANKQVFGACGVKSVGTLAAGSTFYIDTGTGPNQQENLCMCTLIIHTFTGLGINFVFQAEESIKQLNHSIQVGSHILNSTVTKLDIRIKVETDILIKTDGIGGVCVSIANKSEGVFGVNCNSTKITTLATTRSSTNLTSNISQNKTSSVRTTELSFNATTYSPAYSSGENKESLIGPVVGGISGFVVLVAATAIVLYCLRKKKTETNQQCDNDSRQNTDDHNNLEVSQTPHPNYYNMERSENQGSAYEDIRHTTQNDHVYLGISETGQ